MSSALDTHDAPPLRRRPLAFAVFTIVAGVIGWFASFELATEYIHKLKSPDYIPNCNISLLVTCGPNMDSWQGSIFGFSNTIIGLAAFMAPIFVGVALLAGAVFPRWFWWVYRLGLLGGVSLVFWLSYQSIFNIGTLCPWCMVVWAVTIPLFWFTLFYPEGAERVSVSASTRSSFETLLSWSWVIVLVCYLLIAFVAQVQLDWFGEFRR